MRSSSWFSSAVSWSMSASRACSGSTFFGDARVVLPASVTATALLLDSRTTVLDRLSVVGRRRSLYRSTSGVRPSFRTTSGACLPGARRRPRRHRGEPGGGGAGGRASGERQLLARLSAAGVAADFGAFFGPCFFGA